MNNYNWTDMNASCPPKSSRGLVRRAATLLGLLALAAAPRAQAEIVTPRWFGSEHWKSASGREVRSEVSAEKRPGLGVLRIGYTITAGSARYAGAYLHQGVKEPFDELRFRVKSAVSGRALVRFIDQDGEVLQYTVPVQGSSEWTPVSIRIEKPSTTFPDKAGSVLNKEPDFPFTGMLFGFELPKGAEASGEVFFSEPELIR
jgi:hypothetical protein